MLSWLRPEPDNSFEPGRFAARLNSRARASHVDIEFTKGSRKFDEMRITRDGVVETVACPKQRIIPHDMVHYAVETTLQKRGFLSRVRDGEPANFQMDSKPESDGVERLVEVVQGDAWSGGDAPVMEMLELYQLTCTARDCRPLDIDHEDIVAIRRLVQELDAQWQALAIGQSMKLSI
jgi:hypothetical protein